MIVQFDKNHHGQVSQDIPQNPGTYEVQSGPLLLIIYSNYSFGNMFNNILRFISPATTQRK